MNASEKRKSVSISLLPSETAALRAAAKEANETSLSAYVKKILLREFAQDAPKKKGD